MTDKHITVIKRRMTDKHFTVIKRNVIILIMVSFRWNHKTYSLSYISKIISRMEKSNTLENLVRKTCTGISTTQDTAFFCAVCWLITVFLYFFPLQKNFTFNSIITFVIGSISDFHRFFSSVHSVASDKGIKHNYESELPRNNISLSTGGQSKNKLSVPVVTDQGDQITLIKFSEVQIYSRHTSPWGSCRLLCSKRQNYLNNRKTNHHLFVFRNTMPLQHCPHMAGGKVTIILGHWG